MLLHVFVRFEPKPGQEEEVRNELAQVLEPTRTEPGCVRINIYEATREPRTFAIYSAWMDEAAFETHAGLPHTRRFISRVEELITHPVQALRTRQIG